MVSLEGLSKIVDPSQLTADFEGNLEYNHDDWIEVWNLLTLFFFKNTEKYFFSFQSLTSKTAPLLFSI